MSEPDEYGLPHVQQVVGTILGRQHTPSPFSESRYPFTYAYDFYRTHADDFGDQCEPLMSRAQTSAAVTAYAERTGQHLHHVVIELAHGYMGEHNIDFDLAVIGPLLDAAFGDGCERCKQPVTKFAQV